MIDQKNSSKKKKEKLQKNVVSIKELVYNVALFCFKSWQNNGQSSITFPEFLSIHLP